MKRSRKIFLLTACFMVLAAAFTLLVLQPSIIPRKTFSAPESSYIDWEEILSSPQPITIQTYSTGVMQTELSGIMNLAHERAAAIEDVVVEAPVNVSIIHHQTLGYYLIDAGLDSSYIDHQYGSFRGLFVEKTLGKGSQEPNTNIASVIKRKNIALRGVWLTHLHPDHIAGIIDLPKHIPYVAGKGERYINFRFFMRSDHLAGIEALYEIDFTGGIDLPPFGRGIDLLGDGSFWAIESSGHSKGHVMYFINGIEERVLVTGDTCNDQFQFDTGIGPGSFSSDLEQAQQVLETIITFKERTLRSAWSLVTIESA